MEFIGMNKKEFRAKLYQTYIGLGIQDQAVIQGYIKAAETFVFENNQIKVSGFGILNYKSSANENPTMGSRVLGNNEHQSNHIADSGRNRIEASANTVINNLAELVEEKRSNAKGALKLIYQHQFATVDELVQFMARLAYGDENITGSSLK